MKIFKDKNNREWIIKINIATVKYVRERCKRKNGDPLDLLSIIEVTRNGAEADLLSEIASDPVLMVEILYSIIKSQADSNGVSEEQFYESLTGDTIEEATTALVSEIIDFFPEAKRRVLRAIWDRTLALRNVVNEQLKRQMESPEFNEQIDKALSRFGDQSINTPELSE